MAPLVVALPSAQAAPLEPPTDDAPSAQASPADEAALNRAAETGKAVEVLARRTETSQVFANPEGDFTEEVYAVPQWVRKQNTLVDVDTSLTKNDDGTLSPAATEIGMTFSGGGDGPLATLTRENRSLSVGWPSPLPKPSVADDTLTYPEVLPGVDLKVNARSEGFGHVLVVKNATAARNPGLKKIHYQLSGDGLEIAKEANGSLRATDPAGRDRFHAPTPVMWDSSATPLDPTEPAGLKVNSAGAPLDAATTEADAGGRQAELGVELEGDRLTLTPDEELLTGEDTTYPVFIDPSYTASGTRHSWAIAYKKYPNESYFNGNNWRNSNGSVGTTTARAGYENHTNGTSRSYFRMNTTNLQDPARVIKSSRFTIKNTWSWSCSAREVQLWHTEYLRSDMTWNKQPARKSTLDKVSAAKGYNSSCPAGNLAFDTTKAAKQSQANTWKTLTFALKATSETDVYGWKRFDAKTAKLTTTYNTRPNVPTRLDTYPVSTNNEHGCGDKAPYQYIGNTDFYLQARVSDRDGGTVRAVFHLWPTGHNNGGDGLIINRTVSVSSGSVASVKVTAAALRPHLGTANGNFSWKVHASDGELSSDWYPAKGQPGCRFVFDPNRPSTVPEINSTQFPNGSSGWPPNTASVRTQGTFTIGSGGVKDIVEYEYWTSWDSTLRKAKPSTTGGSVSVKLTPRSAGSNWLYARSLDRAGNRSDRASYIFYANGLSVPDKPGDINGDGNADMWAIGADGHLRRVLGAGDGSLTRSSHLAHASDWGAMKITHRGDWNDDGYEDLIGLGHDSRLDRHRMFVFPNNGTGAVCTNCTDLRAQELTVYDEANNRWKNGVRQILAVGDVDGPLDTNGDGRFDTHGHPDLVVNDGRFLWLYYGDPDHRLDSSREPVLLAGPDEPIAPGVTNLNDVTLAAPGDYNGDGRVDLVVRFDKTGELWVYYGGTPDGAGMADPKYRKLVGTNWKPASVPLFTAAPDADNNGKFDLWATTPGSGNMRIFKDYDFRSTTHPTATAANSDSLVYATLG
ncbi:VCBS repeat-containing protein [Streptomyces sp. OF3]|uniref:VCBS repeat-containing protein n=1 Tax=Streptomyces alkaliterrae TaxID=2213162 RepID=A0A7W3ZN56_9ACTN|nr:FG-GAP-like repeat-containing protein [Streptomyces alkaliterrae]MBB1254398.1 VCBS repeat-containing protein [Streptomyces alkaliterrae]